MGQQKVLIWWQCQSEPEKVQLDYVVILSPPDPNTPLEESIQALDSIVRSGKAL
jgi:aryl-alcohol dehydrogenase-like predicted oxidoreductase